MSRDMTFAIVRMLEWRGGQRIRSQTMDQKVIRFEFNDPTGRENAVSTIRNGTAGGTAKLSLVKVSLPLRIFERLMNPHPPNRVPTRVPTPSQRRCLPS